MKNCSIKRILREQAKRVQSRNQCRHIKFFIIANDSKRQQRLWNFGNSEEANVHWRQKINLNFKYLPLQVEGKIVKRWSHFLSSMTIQFLCEKSNSNETFFSYFDTHFCCPFRWLNLCFCRYWVSFYLWLVWDISMPSTRRSRCRVSAIQVRFMRCFGFLTARSRPLHRPKNLHE